MRRSVRWIGAAAAAALLALTGLAGVPRATAQEGLFDLVIVKFTCETDPGQLGFGFDVPDDCEPTGGVAFEVTSEAGNPLDSCTIAADSGGCNVQAPYGTTVLVTEDETTAPDGYAPRENPIVIETPDGPVTGEAPTAIFVNLPAADDNGADDGDDDDNGTTTLPDTGVGIATAPQTGNGALLLAAMSLALAATGFGLRRRTVA